MQLAVAPTGDAVGRAVAELVGEEVLIRRAAGRPELVAPEKLPGGRPGSGFWLSFTSTWKVSATVP
jgi:hypothetical protein